MDIKKIKEEQILKKVYNEKNKNLYKLIDNNSEKPDFILKDIKNGDKFGVEITNMYYNEFSARLHEIPNCVNIMLENGIPRRAEGILKKHQLYVEFENSWRYIGDTIGQSFKKYDDYINALINVINKKTMKAKKYKTLDYLELFIYDKEQYLAFKKIEHLAYLENSEKLKRAINDSPFRRIYFFTVVDKKEMLLLVGDLNSGPLGISDMELKIHREYMEKIFNGDA